MLLLFSSLVLLIDDLHIVSICLYLKKYQLGHATIVCSWEFVLCFIGVLFYERCRALLLARCCGFFRLGACCVGCVVEVGW